MKITRLKHRINLANIVMLMVTACSVVLLVNHVQKKYALEQAEEKSLILLQHNLAIHSYINKQLKPNLFVLTDPVRSPEYFDPVWMSSTFAVRGIDELYRSQMQSPYYYKEAAINARSPENEADDFERGFINRLKQEPGLNKLSGVRNLDGNPYFFTLIRGESMEKGCLRCHSTPDKAPDKMVAAYGATRSFNRTDGELVSAISIRIPLYEAYQEANRFSAKLSLLLLGILLVTYYLQNRLITGLVIAPLDRFRLQADAIAYNADQIGAQIPDIHSEEMNEIARSFNNMSTRIKQFVDGLEQTIEERTAQLVESEAKLRLLFENMTNGFALHQMLYDQAGKPCDYRFIEVNPAFEKLTGLTASQVIGKTVREVIPATEDYWMEVYDTVTRSGEPVSFDHYSEGLQRSFKVWAFCPQPGYFATIFNDISNLVQLEDQLRQSQKLEAIGRLAGGVAHDFNNKLMVILGNAELIQMALPDTGRLPERLQQIMQAAHQSRDITTQLLAFSRQQLTSPRPVELNVTVQATVQNLTVLIGDSIRMIFMPEQESGMVYMDPVQIDQIIMSLVLNARDAMPDGGTLTIATERVSIDEQSSLLSTKAAPGEYLLLSVKDSGVGIDAATLEQIFDPFFTTKDVGKGTGLGLATVYGIVAQNRGFIDVSSQPGIGTVFRIYLPALAD
ncbi:MAG: DUF3365 domain-containing protein [Geobacter sp.]|nr:DUF3365 domain-containing protein [Geobacter sp.]